MALRAALRISSHRNQSLILILHGSYRISALIVAFVLRLRRYPLVESRARRPDARVSSAPCPPACP
jgi:hypothetical protein